MHEQSKGDSLLACARKVLAEDILPNVPPEKKHALLMAMNAISIADRQLRYGDTAAAAESDALRKLIDDPFADPASAGRQLVRLIREGGADPEGATRMQVFRTLRESVLDRLRQSNPKALPTAGE